MTSVVELHHTASAALISWFGAVDSVNKRLEGGTLERNERGPSLTVVIILATNKRRETSAANHRTVNCVYGTGAK